MISIHLVWTISSDKINISTVFDNYIQYINLRDYKIHFMIS